MSNTIHISKMTSFIVIFFFLMSTCTLPAQNVHDLPASNMPQAAGAAAGSDELITVDYKDAKLSSVLRSLAYSYNLNLVTAREVKGKITISLWDVTIDEALDAILTVNGYAYTRKGNIIYITAGPGLEGVDVATEIIPLKYINAAEASVLLEKIISSKGDIRINEVTNSLVLTDFPAFIKRVRKALEEIDTPPVQVLIEAKLVDITEQDFKNMGVTYSLDYKPEGLIKGIFNRDTEYQEELAGTQTMAGPSSTLSGGQLKITAFTLKGLSGSATIDALIQDNKAHLLASPSILTLNGKEARIIIGERYPYKEKTQTTTGTTETTKFVDIGTTLRVTPWVSPDGNIKMYVHPEVSSLTAQLDAGPRIATREADATIMVKDGETIVIGGLIKRQDDSVKGGIPFLKDIPIIGAAFSNMSGDATSTELVVFITPRIVKEQTMETQDADDDQDVYVQIDKSADHVMVNTLWEEARNYEEDKGIESRRKNESWRMAEALDNYTQIYTDYPVHPRAAEAVYRAARIEYKYYDHLKAARDLYMKLIKEHPDSEYADRAERKIRSINRKIEYIRKRSKKKEKRLQELLDKSGDL